MNILIVHQSFIDCFASFFTLATAVGEVDGTNMSRDSRCPSRDDTHMSRDELYDRFVCYVWLSRLPLWLFLITSTYNILLTTVERYAAVIYPIWYKTNVRSTDVNYYTVTENVGELEVAWEKWRGGAQKRQYLSNT